MKYSYKINLDINRDAFNWYEGCNSSVRHNNWKSSAPPDVLDAIIGKTKDEADKFLIPYLKQKYIDKDDEIKNYTKFIEEEFSLKFEQSCLKMIDLLGVPLYRNDFTIFLSTFPRGPYDYKNGYLWICIGWFDPIANFLHELLHFQFIKYWYEEKPALANLETCQFEWLKESLTVVLDEKFIPLIRMPDRGYNTHKEFRQKLHEFWKETEDFNKLVDYGLLILPKFYKS